MARGFKPVSQPSASPASEAPVLRNLADDYGTISDAPSAKDTYKLQRLEVLVARAESLSWLVGSLVRIAKRLISPVFFLWGLILLLFFPASFFQALALLAFAVWNS